MVTLQAVLLVDVAVDAEQVEDRLRGVFGHLGRRLAGVHRRRAEHVEDQHGVVGDDRPPGFADDRRVRHARLVAGAFDAKDDVVGVLLQRVVDRRFEVGLRAVVVDAQATADVEEFHAGAEAVHFRVDAGGLGKRVLELANIRDLAADVEVHQLQAVGHVALLEVVQQLQ